MTLIDRLSRITLNSTNPMALASFYVEALGFSRLSSVQDMDPERRIIPLALGPTRLDLVDVGQFRRPYPDDVPAWSALFQHCAIRINDIAAAMARLEQVGRFKPISTDGPQRLPQASGGVTAYKFRDPEGHPLELISFPETDDSAKSHDTPQPFMCIDHSAISVADSKRSVVFYKSLGLTAGTHSLNQGIEQERLDAVKAPTMEVTALDLPNRRPPHVELLKYRGDYARDREQAALDDIAATRLVFAVAEAGALEKIRDAHFGRLASAESSERRNQSLLLRDPDGHLLQFDVDQPSAISR